MFNAVTISLKAADVGCIAEALVYYGRIDVILRGGTLMPLVETFGFEPLMRAIDGCLIELTYEVSSHVVITNKNPFEVHGFAIAGQSNPKKKRPMSAGEQIEQHFHRKLGNSSEVRAQAKLLGQRVKERVQAEAVLTAIQSQIADKHYLEDAIREMLRTLVPAYAIPMDLGLDAFDTGNGYVVFTKLDFERINEIYHRTVPVEHSSIDMATLLGNMLEAEKEMDFAAKTGADLWADETGSSILRLRANSIANRILGAREHIDYFQRVEFEGRTFRSAINSGEHTTSELLDLLEREDARKFKQWLSKQPPTGALLKEYDRAVFSENSWTKRLPFKTGKLMVFAGIGVAVDQAVGTAGLATAAAVAASYASGLLVGAGEELLSSTLAKGWKPNQFIEGPAAEFVRPAAS
jgi:hypothetical protein